MEQNQSLCNIVGENFVDFLHRKGLSNRSIENYIYYLSKFNWDLNQEGVNEFLNHYNNTISRAFLKNLFEMLKIKDIEIPKQTGTKKIRLPKFISKEDVNKIIWATPNRRNKIMLILTFQGGLRKSELLNIKPLDFNWSKWKDDPERAGELLIKGKGNKERIVYISPKIMKYVYDYINDLSYNINIEDKIFNISRQRFELILNNSSIKGIGKHINPHALRHSCATHLFNEKGWDIIQLKEYLGHSNISSTEIYTHLDKKKLKSKFEESFE